MPEGNRQLLQKGAQPFPEQSAGLSGELRRWLEEHAAGHAPPPVQHKMF